jgi:hypothetical protein
MFGLSIIGGSGSDDIVVIGREFITAETSADQIGIKSINVEDTKVKQDQFGSSIPHTLPTWVECGKGW